MRKLINLDHVITVDINDKLRYQTLSKEKYDKSFYDNCLVEEKDEYVYLYNRPYIYFRMINNMNISIEFNTLEEAEHYLLTNINPFIKNNIII